MAELIDLTETLTDALIYAAYFSLNGKGERPFPLALGVPGLLATVGLTISYADDGFDLAEVATGAVVARVRFAAEKDAINIYVEPAALVFKALLLLAQPITILE